MPIRVLDPTQAPEVGAVTLARRQSSKVPASLALLSNGKLHADTLLRLLKYQLQEHLSIASVTEVAKESSTTNALDEDLNRLAQQCNLALVAIGD